MGSQTWRHRQLQTSRIPVDQPQTQTPDLVQSEDGYLVGASEIQLGRKDSQANRYDSFIYIFSHVRYLNDAIFIIAWPLKVRTSIKKWPRGYWHDLENRRKFLLQFAEEKGFDPSELANWRNVREELRKRVRIIHSCHWSNYLIPSL